MAVSALVGLELAPSPALATVPATAYVVGSALSAPLVAAIQRRLGRGPSFQIGLGVGVIAFALCAFGILRSSFIVFILGNLVAGFYGASSGLYRFAAAELVEPGKRERALSLVLVGGLVGAFFGPGLAGWSRGLLSVHFAGAYVALAVLAFMTCAVLALVRFEAPLAVGPASKGRTLREIAAQPAFIVAVAGAALSFGVMNFLMTATPIAMRQEQHEFHHGAEALKWHVIAMFGPGLFSGRLIARFGALKVMAAGLLLNFLCVALALGGVDLMHFYSALILLGLGWNFLFTGASALLMKCYRPEEKTTAQGAMEFSTASVLTFSSLFSGILVTGQGWTVLNWVALLPMFAIGILLAAYWKRASGSF